MPFSVKINGDIINTAILRCFVVRQENIEKVAESYTPDAVNEAKRLLQEGAWRYETRVRDEIFVSELSGISVIIHDAPLKNTTYFCTGCCENMCAHCLMARLHHEEKKRAAPTFSSSSFIENDIMNFFGRTVERYEEIVNSKGVLDGKFDEDAAKHEAAYSAAAKIWGDIFNNVKEVDAAVGLVDKLIKKVRGYYHRDAVSAALRNIRELVRCRLAELSAEEFADILLKNNSTWMLSFVPDFEEKDAEFILDRLTWSGIKVSELKSIHLDLFNETTE